MKVIGTHIRLVPLLVGLLFGATVSFAASSSTNFIMNSEQMDSGGDIATSTNFKLEGTMGQFVSGSLQSISFTTIGGGGAGSSGGSTGENQVSPSVSTINFSYADNGTALGFSEGITPALSTTSVYVYGTVIDGNGANTITGVTAVFHREAVGVSCAEDIFNCYTPAASCSVTPTTSLSAHYSCRFDISPHIDSTDTIGTYPFESWGAYITVADTSNYTGVSSNAIEVNSVAAFSIATSTIAFPSFALGATTTASTSRSLELTQAGNVPVDAVLSSFTNLTCSQSGFIPKGNFKWAITNVGHSDASSTPFTSTPERAFLNIIRKTGTITPVGSLYFNIGIPTEGVGGTCAGSIILNMMQAN